MNYTNFRIKIIYFTFLFPICNESIYVDRKFDADSRRIVLFSDEF